MRVNQDWLSLYDMTAAVPAELCFMSTLQSNHENLPEHQAHAFYLKFVHVLIYKWLVD